MKRRLIQFFAAVGALWAIWTAYELVVPEPTDVLPDRLSDPDSTPLMSVLAANLSEPILEGNRIVPLSNGDEIFPAMLESIRGARESISFLTYIYWTGQIARDFASEIEAACRRGVEVRVLLDAFGAQKMDDALVGAMRDAGCHVAYFHPVHWYTLRRFNHRTHRRALVVDGREGFTGGVGIAEEWTGSAGDPGHWRDEHFRVEGPAVRYLQGAFAENWREATGEVLSGPALFPELEPAGDAVVVPILEGPGGSVSKTAFAYWMMLSRARERVRIWTPYFVPDPDLMDAMVETAGRGVRVELLVPNELNDVAVVRWASRTFYDDLLEAGVHIYEYQPTMMHVKGLTMDGRWAVVGTANFDSRSFELNYELMLAIEDPALVESLDATFEADVARSRRITPEVVDGWSRLSRIRDWIALGAREQI